MQHQVTLYIPGLLGSDALEPAFFQALELSELELCLSRASSRRHPIRGFESSLFSLFGAADTGSGLPVAAVTYLADVGRQSESMCLRADPVNLQPDRDKVVMIGNQQLSISMDEAGQLADAFNDLFAEDGLKLETPVSNRWYVTGDNQSAITTEPLRQVIGKDIHRHLPEGEHAMQWHSMLNEVQMLFYSNPVNEARRQRGLPEINSVWLWGEGDLPMLPETCWQHLWSNESISSALAQISGTPLASLPASAEDWLEQASQEGSHLVVIEAADDALQQHDIQRWRDMLQSLNDDWLVPLIEALQSNRIGCVRLLTDQQEYEITAKSLKRWWKRRRPLAVLAM